MVLEKLDLFLLLFFLLFLFLNWGLFLGFFLGLSGFACLAFEDGTDMAVHVFENVITESNDVSLVHELVNGSHIPIFSYISSQGIYISTSFGHCCVFDGV